MITAKDIRGPWSEPVYLHSAGFDASILHDDDGRKWIVSLEWETREGYEKPGVICLVEYSPKEKGSSRISETNLARRYRQRMYRSTASYKEKWLLLYYVCGRRNRIQSLRDDGKIQKMYGDHMKGIRQNPIVTSVPGESNERHDPDHLKPKYYQSGQRSAEIRSRKLCRNFSWRGLSGTSLFQTVCTGASLHAWKRDSNTENGVDRRRMASHGMMDDNLAKEYVEESKLPEYPVLQIPDFDDFDGEELGNWYYAPRIMPQSFADVKARPGYVRIRGQESRTSLNKVSILARKLTSVYATVTTKMEYKPEVYQHSAGLIIYYDNMNYINLRKYYSQTLGGSALSIIQLENGEKTEYLDTRIAVEDVPIYLRLRIEGRELWFEWSYDGENYTRIGRTFDTTKFSDEYCKYGEFTGTFVGLTCADRVLHKHYADFDFFSYEADEEKGVPAPEEK